MADTKTALDAIRARIVEARKVTFADGRSVENHALDQLLKAEEVLEARLRMETTAKSSIIRRRVPFYRSGL